MSNPSRLNIRAAGASLLLISFLYSACGPTLATNTTSPVPVPSSSSSASASPGPRVVITALDADKTVHAKVNDEVVIALGTQQSWRFSFATLDVLAPKTTVATVPAGTQGVYTAMAPGTETLEGEGVVSQCTPAAVCTETSKIHIKITIVVDP